VLDREPLVEFGRLGDGRLGDGRLGDGSLLRTIFAILYFAPVLDREPLVEFGVVNISKNMGKIVEGFVGSEGIMGLKVCFLTLGTVLKGLQTHSLLAP